MKPKLDLSKIIQKPLPPDQYYPVETAKTQIVLHHTVSGKGIEGDYSWWANSVEHVATCVIIDYEGRIHQLFSSKHWAHHIAVSSKGNKLTGALQKYESTDNNVKLNKLAIGIEIDSWGLLEKRGDKFYAILDKKTDKKVEVPAGEVITLDQPFRGSKYYQKYTAAQIESVRQLLVYWHERYGISLDYNDDIWDINERALSGKPGLYTHVSYRTDKSDCYPDPDLIAMLKDPF